MPIDMHSNSLVATLPNLAIVSFLPWTWKRTAGLSVPIPTSPSDLMRSLSLVPVLNRTYPPVPDAKSA